MREKVLQILIDNLGKKISGEDMSNQLAVTRAAIWKHIKALRESGFQIESTTGGGYLLKSIPDILLNSTMSYYKKGNWKHNIMETCVSTNKEAHLLGEEGAVNGTLIISKTQEGGRGRLARKWLSPKGGVWMSVVIKTSLKPSTVHPITLLAAVAVSKSIEELCDGLVVKIKWPNDIHIKSKKVCGILVEMSADMDGVKYVVVGIGINANNTIKDFNNDVKSIATSLLDEGYSVNRAQLACAINDTFIKLVKMYECEKSLKFVRDYYSEHMAWLDKSVVLKKAGFDEIVYTGVVKGIGEFGQLLLDEDGKTIEIISGELSLRRQQ